MVINDCRKLHWVSLPSTGRPLHSLEERPRSHLTSRKSKAATARRTLVEPQERQPFPNCNYAVIKNIRDFHVWVFFPSERYFPCFPFQSHFLCHVKCFLSFAISFLTSCKIPSLFVVLEKKSAYLSLSFVSQHTILPCILNMTVVVIVAQPNNVIFCLK